MASSLLSQTYATEAAVLNGSSDTLTKNEYVEQIKQRPLRKSAPRRCDADYYLTCPTYDPQRYLPLFRGKLQACNHRDLTGGFGNIRPVHNDVASFWQLESL
jgi:hypothetical protein